MQPTAVMAPYIFDILEQPRCLRNLDQQATLETARRLASRLTRSDRIVLTGMGASLAALRPLWLDLIERGLSAWLIETGELLAGGWSLLTNTAVVIAASQSGNSAEIAVLAERVCQLGAGLVAITNNLDSALGRRSEITFNIAAGLEATVSTKTYVNTLMVATLISYTISQRAADGLIERTADSLDSYLEHWRDHVGAIDAALGLPQRLFLVGRGASLASVECGALIIKEAAKWPVEGQSAQQFRHGPLELADDRLTVCVLAGAAGPGQKRNRQLFDDLRSYGARAFWLEQSDATVPMPTVVDGARQIAEIIPFQLMSVAIANQTGIEPGRFRHLGKVTTVE